MTALLLLQEPAAAETEVEERNAARQAEIAERQAEVEERNAARQAEVEERNAARQAEVEERNAARQAEIAERQVQRQAEVEARNAARQAEIAERPFRPSSPMACGCLPLDGFGSPATFTLDADFDRGESNNVVHTPSDQLQLADQTSPFPFLWVAVSSRFNVPNQKGTIVKIDTRSAQIVGEYWTSPEGQPADPSRTTVDPWGNVWATNRAGNSVVRIGMVENHQCTDHNGIPGIQTSTGQGDIRPWTDTGGNDTNGGVSAAQDDCVIAYTRTTAEGTRHISVSLSQDIWVSGTRPKLGPRAESFDLIQPDGTVLRTEPSVNYGGYGGLTDKQGVIWSAGSGNDSRWDTLGLLRWDTGVPLANVQLAPSSPGPAPGPVTGYPSGALYGGFSYGLCIDSAGNVWNSDRYDGKTRKFAPDGTLLGAFPHGNQDAQGCVVDLNDDVWVAHSAAGSQTVGHLTNAGTYLGAVTVGSGPTGAAVDRDGAIWVTNYAGGSVSRIDPSLGPLGLDGVTPLGAVTGPAIDVQGAPYDYSDMTGSAVPVHPKSGSWEVVYDCGPTGVGAGWGPITRNATVPAGGDLVITASSSVDGLAYSVPVQVMPGVQPGVPDGRFLKVRVVFLRDPATGVSPILHDLTLRGTDPTRTDCCDPDEHVVPPPPPPPAPSERHVVRLRSPKPDAGASVVTARPELARTGAQLGGLVMVAALSFLLGGTLLVLSAPTTVRWRRLATGRWWSGSGRQG